MAKIYITEKQYMEEQPDGSFIHNGKVVYFDENDRPFINWTKKDQDEQDDRVHANRLAFDMPNDNSRRE
jgi:hypothetical protein